MDRLTTPRLTLLSILLALLALGCDVHEHSFPVPGRPAVLAIHPSAAQTTEDGPVYSPLGLWAITDGRGLLRFPLPLRVGDAITEWSLAIQRTRYNQFGPAIGAGLQRLEAVSGIHLQVGMDVTSTRREPGYIDLRTTVDPPYVVSYGETITLVVGGDGYEGDLVGGAEVHVLEQ